MTFAEYFMRTNQARGMIERARSFIRVEARVSIRASKHRAKCSTARLQRWIGDGDQTISTYVKMYESRNGEKAE